MNTSVAVILSGCGVYDGAEINEVVLTILALEEHDINYECFAPDVNLHHVINHFTGEEVNEVRNVLIESARIVRGKIKDITKCSAANFSALVIPGGFGVAKNLSNFTTKGVELDINQDLLNLFNDFKEMKKPVACMCIAPVLLPKVYGPSVSITIGNDIYTSNAIKKMGGIHVNTDVDGIVYDEKNNILTTPAYMLATTLIEARSGINALIARLCKLIK
jgi:enhancing lycopene biosynthesis protein 2